MSDGSFQFREVRRRLPALRSGAAGDIRRLLIRSVDARGRVGFGEVAPWPGFPTESLEEAAATLSSAKGDLGNLRRAVAAAALPCLGAALSMMAEWDAVAGFAGELSCAGLLGEEEGAARAAVLAEKGYACLKAKAGPGADLPRLRAILAATPKSVSLRVDANGRLDLRGARELLDWARGEARVEFVEQPLAPGDPGYASLGAEKVALDESFLSGTRRTPEAVGWKGVVVVKPAMGGDWGALRRTLAGMADEGRVVVSSSFETAIGFQAGLAFAAGIAGGRAAGFGTLGSDPAWEGHSPGPRVRGRPEIDWEALWARAA
ncbi:MAG: enolase C-terminal domain-like protein [Opitutia bacterium]